jgi:hypothetical protein
MAVIALALALLLQTPCAGAQSEAAALVERFDLAAAAAVLRAAAGQGCADARVGAIYLQGLTDARTAFSLGAPPASLQPIRDAIATLEKMAAGRPGQPEIARLLLQAAAAGAQSERAEMALYLDSASRMETLQRAARQPGAPFVSGLELAGDLWLQLFDYMRARTAYADAVEQGRTMRATAGLARATARLGIETGACVEYQRLVERWADRTPKAPEITEAEAYLQRATCRRMSAP